MINLSKLEKALEFLDTVENGSIRFNVFDEDYKIVKNNIYILYTVKHEKHDISITTKVFDTKSLLLFYLKEQNNEYTIKTDLHKGSD